MHLFNLSNRYFPNRLAIALPKEKRVNNWIIYAPLLH